MTAPTPDPTPYWALTADELTTGAVAAHFGSEVLDPLARIIAFYQHCGYAGDGPDPQAVVAAIEGLGTAAADLPKWSVWAADLDGALAWGAEVVAEPPDNAVAADD